MNKKEGIKIPIEHVTHAKTYSDLMFHVKVFIDIFGPLATVGSIEKALRKMVVQTADSVVMH